MEEKAEKLQRMLAGLVEVGSIEASAVIRRDGLMIASNLTEGVDSRTVAAMSAALVGTAETCSAELKRGRFMQVIIESENGQLVATGAGELAILVCLVSRKGNMGLVLLEMGKVASKIATMLSK